MSLYNMIFGQNPAADILLAVLGITREQCGRFRDCFTNDDGTQIIIHTRNGGGNREAYENVFESLSKHPNYIEDRDDDFDCTYADIIFSVPEKYSQQVKTIADATDTTPPAQKWEKLLSAMQSGEQSQHAERALKIGAQLFKAIGDNVPDAETEIKNEEGCIIVQKASNQ